MMKTTKTTKKGAKTQSDEERVAAGLAFKDREGTFSEFLLLYWRVPFPGPSAASAR